MSHLVRPLMSLLPQKPAWKLTGREYISWFGWNWFLYVLQPLCVSSQNRVLPCGYGGKSQTMAKACITLETLERSIGLFHRSMVLVGLPVVNQFPIPTANLLSHLTWGTYNSSISPVFYYPSWTLKSRGDSSSCVAWLTLFCWISIPLPVLSDSLTPQAPSTLSFPHPAFQYLLL